jgi:hypothetical protein
MVRTILTAWIKLFLSFKTSGYSNLSILCRMLFLWIMMCQNAIRLVMLMANVVDPEKGFSNSGLARAFLPLHTQQPYNTRAHPLNQPFCALPQYQGQTSDNIEKQKKLSYPTSSHD